MRGRAATASASATSRGILVLELRERDRERVAQAREHLERREVRVRQLVADEVAPAVRREHVLEVAQELRHPLLAEMPGALPCRGLLVLVVEARAERVMRVVRLGQEVGERELQRVDVVAQPIVVRHEPQPRTEELQDQRVLPISRSPTLKTGGANGRIAPGVPRRSATSARTPPPSLTGRRATST